MDASLWWLLLLRLYVNASDDRAFAARKTIQQATAAILDLYLVAHFELIPTLLVPDGAFMIDRRMGMYGHLLDIEVLFYAALRAAREILLIVPTKENSGYVQKVEHRLGKDGAMIGKEARRLQVWTIAGFIAADSLLETPEKASLLFFKDKNHAADCPLGRGG